jgi:dipeptidyl aminopeptidase/acylaminoacyl peptidase
MEGTLPFLRRRGGWHPFGNGGASPQVFVQALLALALATGFCATAQAEREPVLKQVHAPHSYYWRELYLPQLTTGPSSVAFMPGSREVVYSMAGSLWRQRLGSSSATELTHVPGAYDYQPDVASDGRRVAFARYDGASVELWELDLASGRERALTKNGAVNVEPRWSPDGRRIAWVSTQREGQFAVYLADTGEAGLANPQPLLPLRRSTIDRYYYSAIDHSINPAWSPDGQRLYFVGNAEVAWGTGDVYSIAVADPQRPAQGRERRDDLERAARARTGREARALLELSRPAMASVVAHRRHPARRRCR